MKALTQKQIDKLPTVSNEVLAATSDHLRNYIVYIGKTFPVGFETIHVGFASTNHLATIQDLVHGQPIYKVLLDNRKWN